jgi:hypothetical protein
MVKMRYTYKILGKKNERKRPLEKLRYLWKYNIKIDLQEIEYEDVDHIQQGQNKMMVSCKHGNKTSGFIKGEEFPK